MSYFSFDFRFDKKQTDIHSFVYVYLLYVSLDPYLLASLFNTLTLSKFSLN